MKRSSIKVLVIGFLIQASMILCLQAEELPFGAYDLDLNGADFSAMLHVLHDSLGFNIFWENEYIDASHIVEFADSGMAVIRQGKMSDTVTDSITALSHLNYAKIEVEDFSTPIRMYNCGGDFIGDFWVSDSGSADTLYGPNGQNSPCGWEVGSETYIKMHKGYVNPYIYPEENDSITDYYCRLSMKIESGAGTNDTVAYLRVVFEHWNCISRDTTLLMTITGAFFTSNDSLTILTTPTSFNLPDTIICHDDDTLFLNEVKSSTGAAFIIETTGKRKVSVDWLKIYDERGYYLVETDEYADELKRNADEFDDLGEDMWGWGLRDEPYFPNMQPMGIIQDTIRAYGYANWNVMAALNYRQYYDWWFEWIDSDVVTPDIYPFIINSDGDDSTSFTGYDASNKHMYMQSRLNDQIEEYLWARNAADSSGKEYWPILQSFNQHADGGWRKPTYSEMLVQTYLALAYGARGIIYWKYGETPSADLYGLDSSGTRRDIWYAIRDDINPYIKAIDSLYLGLEWDLANTCSTSTQTFSQPALVYSITPYCDSINPDLGWFHVGEFRDESCVGRNPLWFRQNYWIPDQVRNDSPTDCKNLNNGTAIIIPNPGRAGVIRPYLHVPSCRSRNGVT